jgi:hypothetical protein
MKNIILIPTKGLDRNRGVLFADSLENGKLVKNFYDRNIEWKDCAYYHIYITDASEIKEGDWYLVGDFTKIEDVRKSTKSFSKSEITHNWYKKIILTTDSDLIADGVQAIDNEFFDWFVENTTCEFVDVIKEMYVPQSNGKISDGRISHEISLDPSENTLPFYKIIIPKEELEEEFFGYDPNAPGDPDKIDDLKEQKTLEEAAENYSRITLNKNGLMSDKQVNGFIAGAKWQSKRMYSEEEVLEHLNHLIMMKSSELDRFTDDEEMVTMKWFERFKKK